MPTIKIRYIEKSNPKLQKTKIGSWIDLYLAKDIELVSGQRDYLPMGIAMKLPIGYEAIMAPRSSTYKNWGLLQTNSIGVIDSTFCGDQDEWQMPVLATRDIKIPKGTRLCQFRIQKEQPDINFQEVKFLNTKSRGGLGSTGQ
jgi:dUTP pyrophosphatase